VASTPN